MNGRQHLVLGLVCPGLVLVWMMSVTWDFTIDDAYISFRYARNLVDGHGLVYNPGERVEGYTNLAWTLMIAAGMKLGIDPHPLTKIVGAASAVALLAVAYRLSERLQPFGRLPCVATWVLALTFPVVGHAVFGLETIFFAALVGGGILMMLRELERPTARPWSGLVFALAGLCRPETPMFLGVAMLALGRGFWSRQNIHRGLLFAVPLLVHLMWRYAYYGELLPMTFLAKTGGLDRQLYKGRMYLLNYWRDTAVLGAFGSYGLALAILRRRVDWLIVAALTLVPAGYIWLVGGDWMPGFRLIGHSGLFYALLLGASARKLFEFPDRPGRLAIAIALALGLAWEARSTMRIQERLESETMPFWQGVPVETADFLAEHAPYGAIVLGDIGWVGWRTNYPIVDILGLVYPRIAHLPGGYRHKIGPGFTDAIYEPGPEYLILLLNDKCKKGDKRFQQLIDDPRLQNYRLAHRADAKGPGSWCIYARKDVPIGPDHAGKRMGRWAPDAATPP